MSRPSNKEALLDAAEAVVLESGAAHLTLDAVAERSGISKGGLIYHFPSKEALLGAMILRLMERYESLHDKARAEMPDDADNEMLIEIKTLMDLTGGDHRLGVALLAVTANQPDLATAFRDRVRERFFEQLVAGGNMEWRAILFFAAVGLHFHELLKISPLDDDQQRRVFERLMDLARRPDII